MQNYLGICCCDACIVVRLILDVLRHNESQTCSQFFCIMPWTYSVSIVRTFIRCYVCRYIVRSVCPYVRDLFYSG